MASIPGLNGDVYFGDPEKPLPDWRAEIGEEDEDDDDDDTSEEQLAAVKAMLGFDPAELNDEPEEPEEEDDDES